MSGELSDDDEMLAAELAFGLIDGAEGATARARVGSDQAFADAHARWESHAATMVSDRGEAPDAAVWTAIEARLPANDDTPRASARSLRGWQFGTLAASAAALVLGFAALEKPRTVYVRAPVAQIAAAPMVAVLTGREGLVTVSYDPASGHITSAVHGLAIGDHSPELWVIPADGKPRSMGVISVATPKWKTVPTAASAALSAGVTIAISVEPAGGSPSGKPTGPVILTGKMIPT